jgi:hypothetical protein
MSFRSEKQNREYRKIRKVFLEENPQCQCVIHEHQCRHRATQIHHKRGRGKDLCNTEFFMGVCGACHEYIERNRSWSKEKGYLINRASSYVLLSNNTKPIEPQP